MNGPFAERRNLRLSVIIPTMNEAASVGWVLENLPDTVDEVIVVDGRSTDETIEVVQTVRPDARIILERTPGKGAAIRAGFAAARGDFIVMIDADGSMDPAEIERCVAALRDRRTPGAAGEFDMVKGSRFLRGGGTSDMTRSVSSATTCCGASSTCSTGSSSATSATA